MNMPITLLSEVLTNYRILTRVAVDRDLEVIRDRFKHEGMSFLTISLPTLDDALLHGLSTGRLTPSTFPGFKPWRRGGNLPALMAGFFRRVFDDLGFVLDEPCVTSIDAIRQVTRLYKKVELPCSKERVTAAFERYKSNDEKCFSSRCRHLDSDSLWAAVSGVLWSSLELRTSDLYCSDGVFGNGATSERKRLNQRFDISQWPTRGDKQFPACIHTSHDEGIEPTWIEYLASGGEHPVRVVTVPKTLKTPRIIAVEPSYTMLRQQSVWRWLKQYLEGRSFPFSSIRFTDQSVNRKLARRGSVDGGLATIDLSDASDLVSNYLVAKVFRSCPSFLQYIYAARTRQARLPDGEILNLRKYASMGSALCFPIESMVFFTVALYAVCKESGQRPSRSVLLNLSKEIAVYGDDIIAPTQMAGAIMRELEACGLRVNADKSFDSGLFRESCGGDYYAGENVTPVYVRQPWNELGTKLESRVIAAYISLSNQFYMKGLWHASQFIRDSLWLRKIRVGRSTEGAGGLCYYSTVFTDARGYDSSTYRYLVRTFVPGTDTIDDPINTIHGAMLYSFGKRVQEPREYPVYYGRTDANHGATPVSLDGSQSILQDPSRNRDFHHEYWSGLADDDGACGSLAKDDESERPDFPSIYDPPAKDFLCRFDRGSLAKIRSGSPYDGTSARPYSLNLKSRLTPTPVGLSW